MGVAKLLHGQPRTRPLIGTVLPAVLRDTVVQLARYAERGRPVPRQLVARVLARQTAAVLNSRSYPRPAYRRRPKRRVQRVPRKRDVYQSMEWWDNGHGS